MHLNKLRHSHSVAIKMQEIGKKLGLEETEINQLFILGLNHDIGYQFIKSNLLYLSSESRIFPV